MIKKYYKVTLRIIDGTDELKGYRIKSYRRLLKSGNDKALKDIIVYKSGMKFKEIITDMEIPYLIITNHRVIVSSISPVYFGYLSKNHASSTWKSLDQLQVYSEEVEKYLKEKLNINTYDNNSNYIDPKEEYRKELMKLFELGKEEFEKFSEANFKKNKKKKMKEKKEDEKIKVLMKEYLQK